MLLCRVQPIEDIYFVCYSLPRRSAVGLPSTSVASMLTFVSTQLMVGVTDFFPMAFEEPLEFSFLFSHSIFLIVKRLQQLTCLIFLDCLWSGGEYYTKRYCDKNPASLLAVSSVVFVMLFLL